MYSALFFYFSPPGKWWTSRLSPPSRPPLTPPDMLLLYFAKVRSKNLGQQHHECALTLWLLLVNTQTSQMFRVHWTFLSVFLCYNPLFCVFTLITKTWMSVNNCSIITDQKQDLVSDCFIYTNRWTSHHTSDRNPADETQLLLPRQGWQQNKREGGSQWRCLFCFCFFVCIFNLEKV